MHKHLAIIVPVNLSNDLPSADWWGIALPLLFRLCCSLKLWKAYFILQSPKMNIIEGKLTLPHFWKVGRQTMKPLWRNFIFDIFYSYIYFFFLSLCKTQGN